MTEKGNVDNVQISEKREEKRFGKVFVFQCHGVSNMDERKCDFWPPGSHLCSANSADDAFCQLGKPSALLCNKFAQSDSVIQFDLKGKQHSERPIQKIDLGSEQLIGDQEQTSNQCRVLAACPALH